MRICLLGTQGTGKTTLLNQFSSQYYVIDNIARNVISKGGKSNQNGDTKTQKLIFNDYISTLQYYKHYLSTRSMIDVCAYTYYLYKNKHVTNLGTLIEKIKLYFELKREIHKTKSWFENNPDCVICYIPIEFDIENDGVRSIDTKYQKDIDTIMKYFFDNFNLRNKYIIKGSIYQRTEQLYHIIDKHNIKCSLNI